MPDQTPEERIQALETENAALRAAAGNPLHPPIEPVYFVGSVVLYGGKPHQVTGRSIDRGGVVEYTVLPVTGSVVQVDGHDVRRYALDDPAARGELAGVRTYDLAHPIYAEAVYEAAEADLEPLHEHDTTAYAIAAEAVRHAGRPVGESGTAVEGASVVKAEV